MRGAMDIQINTDRRVILDEALRTQIQDDVDVVLAHVTRPVTRVEVHLSDESARRAVGDHIRCVAEARPTGHEPVTVTAHGPTSSEAAAEAIDELGALLHHTFDRLADKGRRDTIRHR